MINTKMAVSSTLAIGYCLLQSSIGLAQTVDPSGATATRDAAEAPPLAQPGTGNQVEEIVVTAQFRDQNLQKTPIAITAVSGSMLEARSQTNISQVAGQAPSVNLQPGNAAFGPSLVASIRGVGQFDYIPAVEPGVGLYVDDVYYATLTGSIFDLLDVDRIEILRGPQGTLAGRNSIGGAIKVYSKRPTGSGSGLIQATYGIRDRIDLRGSLDFNLAPGLDARVAGVARRQKGYVKDYDFGCANPPGSANNPAVGGIAPVNPIGSSCLIDRYGEVDYQAVRGQLRYHPSDAIDINLIADYTHDSRSPSAAVLTFANGTTNPGVQAGATAVPFDNRFLCGRYCTYANGYAPADPANGLPFATTRKPFISYDGFGFSLEGEFQLSDALKLTSITAYREYDAPFMSDDDGSPFPLSNTYQDLKFDFFSQELRLNGSFANDRILYTVGGYYSSQKTKFLAVLDIRAAGLQFSSPDDRIPAHSKAAFANVTATITDALTFNGGIRYTKEDKDYTFTRRFPDGTLGQPIVGPLEGVVGRYAGDRVDYRANLQYQWTPDVMTYAQFSTGFKGGGVNARPFIPSQAVPFSPESINAYEIGLKSDLFDRTARVNLSAFYNDYKDIQLNLSQCPSFNPPGFPANFPCQATANAGNAKVQGIELEASLRPTAGLLIDGSVSYLDFQYKSLVDDVTAGAGGVRLSNVAPYQSKWKWNVGAQYEIALASSGTITPRLDVTYQSSFFTTANNAPTSRVPGYTLANARLSWRSADRDFEISGELTNIFDKYYFTNVFDQAFNQGYTVAQPGRPREWALTVTKRF